MKALLKNLRIYATHVLNSAIHQHFAWPDPISQDGTFNEEQNLLISWVGVNRALGGISFKIFGNDIL